MDGGLGLWNSTVVDLDLNGLAEDEDALHRAAARWDHEALGDGVGVDGAHGNWNFTGGVPVVGDIDGYEPVAGLGSSGEDAIDLQFGQALVGVDPIGEEPGEVAVVGGGVFERSGVVFEATVPFMAADRVGSPTRSRSIQKT